MLGLQIWAEATRSPAVAGFVSAFNRDLVERLVGLVEAAREAGRIAPAMPSREVATLILTLADGLFLRRAVVPDFDAASELPPVLALVRALLTGRAIVPEAGPKETVR